MSPAGNTGSYCTFFVHEDEVSSNEMHAEQDIISIRGRNDVIHLINSYYHVKRYITSLLFYPSALLNHLALCN